MTFWDHLDELRATLVAPLAALVLFTAVAFALKGPVFRVVLAANSPDFITYRLFSAAAPAGAPEGPVVHLVSTELPAQFLMHMKVSFYAGFLLTVPFLLYRLFRYAAPGLYPKERSYSARILFFACLAFVAGLAVNYFAVFPVSLRFLAGYRVSPQVGNLITLGSYLDTLMLLSILMGACFELPVLSWLFVKLGLLQAATLRTYRRHAILGILVVAAVITPTTDIFTLLLVSVPVVALYELSIGIAALAEQPKTPAPGMAPPGNPKPINSTP